MMRAQWLISVLLIGILVVTSSSSESTEDASKSSSTTESEKSSSSDNKNATNVASSTVATTAELKTTAKPSASDGDGDGELANKDKRQIGRKDTSNYANHRIDMSIERDIDDDPEDPQETVYGGKPPAQQFLIRPMQHQHLQQQLRNYPVTLRPHGAQLLEQSQEIQHFAYLQELNRNAQKLNAASTQLQAAPTKKKAARLLAQPTQSTIAQQLYNEGGGEEAEQQQRYAIAVRNAYASAHGVAGYLPLQQQQHQQQSSDERQSIEQQQQQLQAGYQIIPEEQFLKLLEEELQARAYHEQLRQQQQQQQQHQQQQQLADTAAAAATKPPPPQPPTLRPRQQPHIGLGGYRQRYPAESQEQPQQQQLIQYIPHHRGGPKFLPLPQSTVAQLQQQQQQQQQQLEEEQQQQQLEQELQQPQSPTPIAYYQPQISYKTLPNHPLAKSSLEKEIEKLLATNKPSVQIIDSSNEPTAALIHQQQQQQQLQLHQQQQQQQQQQQLRLPRPTSPTKTFIAATTPNSLLDANNQPFVPSLFRFSSFQPPTPIYPTQLPQHVVDGKKLGPVVYPTQSTSNSGAYYTEPAVVTSKAKVYQRPKQFGHKLTSATAASAQKPKGGSGGLKFTNTHQPPPQQQLIYEFDAQPQQPQHQFYPSPPDPIKTRSTATPPTPAASAAAAPSLPPVDFRQYALPAPPPSQSSIFVSQGTGIATSSRPRPVHKPKTVDDVKQLRLPQPGGKPLTQAEFQALVDAGYPVTAVPVPVPVPIEQYMRDHPEYRNQQAAAAAADYAQLMRFGANAQQRAGLALPSEPSVKIISSPASDGGEETVSAIGGGSVTYLRPLSNGGGGEKTRRSRAEHETEVAGGAEQATSVDDTKTTQ